MYKPQNDPCSCAGAVQLCLTNEPFPHLRNILGGIPEQDVAVAKERDPQ